MSDMPAAAFWALAVYGCLRGSRTGAALAGAAAAIAILIRPNLVPVALVIALWLAARDRRLPTLRARIARVFLFAIPVALGCLAVAAINQQLYGSATSSGYGDPGTLFSPDRIGPEHRQVRLVADRDADAAWRDRAVGSVGAAGVVRKATCRDGRAEPSRRHVSRRSSAAIWSIAPSMRGGTSDFFCHAGRRCVSGQRECLHGPSGQGFNRTGKSCFSVWASTDCGTPTQRARLTSAEVSSAMSPSPAWCETRRRPTA